MLNSNAVILRWVQIKLSENVFGVLQAIFVPEKDEHLIILQFSDRCLFGTEEKDNLLLHGCHLCSGYLPLGPQRIRHMSIKQLSHFSHLQYNQPHQLTQILPTDHLLKAKTGKKQKTTEIKVETVSLMLFDIMRKDNVAFPTVVFQGCGRLHRHLCQTQ